MSPLAPATVRRTVLVLLGVAAVAMTPGLPPALRLVAVLPLFLLAPGLAWAWALPLRRAGDQVVAAVALSIAVDVLVAEALLYAGVLAPVTVFAAIGAVAVAGVVALGPAVEGRAVR
jgi:hypothetical protein